MNGGVHTHEHRPQPICDPSPVEIARRLVPVLKALSDENRLTILLVLARRAYAVRELGEAVRLPQTLVSHHLKALRDAGVVTVTAEGRSNLYSLCCGALAEPVRLLNALASATDPSGCPAPQEPQQPQEAQQRQEPRQH